MELEGLKKTWEVHTNEQGSKLIVSKSTVEHMLKRKADHSRRKIIKKMGLDAVSMLLVNSAFIITLYYMGFQSRHLYALLILAITLLLFVHYHFSMIVVQRSSSHESISKGIRKTILTMKRYFKIYKTVFPALIFISLFGTQYLNYLDLSPLFGLTTSMLSQVFHSLLFAILGYLALTFIINRLYKKDLFILENLEKELAE